MTISSRLMFATKPLSTRFGPKLRTLSTAPCHRLVRLQNSTIDEQARRYPTPGRGHDFQMNIFGLVYKTSDINDLQSCIWDEVSFLPRQPANQLPRDSVLSDISDIASRMAVTLQDGSTPGLLAKNELRSTVADTLKERHFAETMTLLQKFQQKTDPRQKEELGRQISDLAFWSQWLIRGVLFEGKLHWEHFCEEAIRAPLSQIAFATNAAPGRHQIDFVYDDYTLKAAIFPHDLDSVDYDSPESIKSAVARIETPVGFLSMKGGTPEHNFRHIHSLMEYQMKTAFAGSERIFAGDLDGWKDIVEAAKRANRVFHTMLQNTPPHSYPMIRLPIKGVRGACGTVYHPHGVFYEGVGTDEYVLHSDGTRIKGVFVNNEWGQTGANSSMYKWFDMFCGVAQIRGAYAVDPHSLAKMSLVFSGDVDSGELGHNPIDSMQRAFDLFTRPPLHMNMLVDTDERLQRSGVLETSNPGVLPERLRLAYWVADHRMTHGRYVLKSIYQTQPVGGQSRAAGTGGSKLFLDQTIQPGRAIMAQLLMCRDQLNGAELEEVAWHAQMFDEFEAAMDKVRQKGEQLELEERVASLSIPKRSSMSEL